MLSASTSQSILTEHLALAMDKVACEMQSGMPRGAVKLAQDAVAYGRTQGAVSRMLVAVKLVQGAVAHGRTQAAVVLGH